MQYRSIEYSLAQEENQDAWKWTVNISETMVASGTRKTREGRVVGCCAHY